MEIKELIYMFIEEKSRKYKKTVLNRLLISSKIETNKRKSNKKDTALIKQDDFPYYLDSAIKETVTSYPYNKETAINIMKDLVVYLEKHGIYIEIEFPPAISDTEKEMYVLRSLNNSTANIASELWVSQKNISNMITKMADKGIPILGRKFKLHGAYGKRLNGKNALESYPYPLCLTPNLTQVMVTLIGLRRMSEDTEFGLKGNATTMAQNIWMQLSQYGKYRLIDRLPEFRENTEWYKALESDRDNTFLTEVECCTDGYIHFCVKHYDQLLYFDYIADDGTIIEYDDCKFITHSWDDRTITIRCNHKIITLSDSKIKKCFTNRR